MIEYQIDRLAWRYDIEFEFDGEEGITYCLLHRPETRKYLTTGVGLTAEDALLDALVNRLAGES